MSRAPAILDLARLLDEHATAAPAAASTRLEEVNQLAYHRRLVLAVVRVEDCPAREVEQDQDLGVRRRRIARLQSTGRREQARQHLATATTMYREMGMIYWLEKAEAPMKGGSP